MYCNKNSNNFYIGLDREWVIKIPIILVLGVATTVDSLRSILSSNAFLYLSVCEFTLGTPTERIDAVIEAVILRRCESFSVGKQVSTFLRNYFLRHDGTLNLYTRALRVSMQAIFISFDDICYIYLCELFSFNFYLLLQLFPDCYGPAHLRGTFVLHRE